MIFSSMTGFIRTVLLVVAIVASSAFSPAAAGTSILFDVQSGKVLAEENATQRWYPASLTKLMTAYIAFRAIKSGQLMLSSVVRISANAAKQPPSKMGYKPGNVLNLDNALKIMLVKSANDIAVAVGETVGGKNYQTVMNLESQRLGMTGTHWANANGLHSPQNYSTARDLAVLTYALRREFPEYASYFNIEAIKYGDKLQRNYNILLGRFAGADGMKTGFVCASGFNLVASATRNGRTLVAVVLGATSQEQRAEKAAELLSRGFADGTLEEVTLASLKASGKAQAVNMKAAVCSKEAASDRWDGRDVEGRMVINSVHIKAMTREPQTVLVGLGKATGPGGTLVAENDNADLSNIPVPTPRPVRAGEEMVPLALSGDGKLRKGMPLPATTNY